MSTAQAGVVEHGGEEQGERYRTLFDNSLDPIYLSCDDGRILKVNPAFRQVFGYSSEELSKVSAEALYVDATDRARFRVAITQNGALKDFETRLRARDGGIRTCLITATARRAADGTTEYQGIIRDVTERRLEQAELARATDALRRSNAELEQFAYVASHDLQEPLRKIRAFGDRLSKLAADRLDEKGVDYLARMVSAAERMQTLIENLLLYSRVTSRGVDFQRVDLNGVLEDVLADLEAQITAAGAEIRVGDLPRLDADPMQMNQLFQNLISNAVKYGPTGGGAQVEIRSELLDSTGGAVAPERSGEAVAVRIAVSDNGIGFEPEYADRIFELFQRLHGRGGYEGTGIGLGICRKIALRHEGSIEAEGRPGEGATFTVVLPLTQEQEDPDA